MYSAHNDYLRGKQDLVFGLSGKGREGKTTIALMVKIPSESDPEKNILVIDANPC